MIPSRQIILDTETTGLYPGSGDRIVEFAGLEMVNRHLTEQNLHLYMHPERDMPEEAAAVHGLTIKVLEEKNAPVFAKVGREIADFLRGAELIIHNAKFDVGFLNMEFERMGLPTVEALGCKITDTLAMAREIFPGKRNNLDALCDRFDIDRSNRTLHGALIDCELLADVYLAMTRGQESLEMAIEPDQGEGGTLRLGNRKPLVVQKASEAECAVHSRYLELLDKKAGGPCVWRDYEPLPPAAGTEA